MWQDSPSLSHHFIHVLGNLFDNHYSMMIVIIIIIIAQLPLQNSLFQPLSYVFSTM